MEEKIMEVKEEVINLKSEVENAKKETIGIEREYQEAITKRDEIEDKTSGIYQVKDAMANKILKQLEDTNKKAEELRKQAEQKIQNVVDEFESNKEKLNKQILENKNEKERIEKDITILIEAIKRDKEENNISDENQIMQNRMKKIVSLKSESKQIEENISKATKEIEDIDSKMKFLDYDNIEKIGKEEKKENNTQTSDNKDKTEKEHQGGIDKSNKTSGIDQVKDAMAKKRLEQLKGTIKKAEELKNQAQKKAENATNESKSDEDKQTLEKEDEKEKIEKGVKTLDEEIRGDKKDKSDNKENLVDEQLKNIEELTKQIITQMGKDYKNIDFTPGEVEKISIDLNDEKIKTDSFDRRDPEELYKEGEELPDKQVEGLEFPDDNEELEELEFPDDSHKEDEEDKDEEKNINNIYIHISENDEIIDYEDSYGKTKIPISLVLDDKKAMYKRLEISKICKQVKKENKGKGKLKGKLKRKVNPEIVKTLDATGNGDMIKDYIKSIYTGSKLPFDLTHDLSGLSRMQKWRMKKYIKAEERCGAKIIGRMWNKNKSLPESEVTPKSEPKKEQQAIKEEVAKDVKNIMRAEKNSKSFVPKVDGKNAEVAKKYREGEDIAELLNSLGFNYTEADKFTMADYIRKNGEEAAKKRFSKQFAGARVNRDIKRMKKEKRERELPGNKNIAGKSKGEAR